MAMIVNELTTNAVKYGALSRIGGTLTLAWQVVGNGKAPTLKLTWREDNGAQAAAPVAPPQRRGFGSLLIEQGVTRELQGSLSSQFEPGGLVSTIELPLKRVIATRYAARGRLRERLPASP